MSLTSITCDMAMVFLMFSGLTINLIDRHA